jgi:hypothetical protein
MTNRRLFIACIAILLAGIVLCVALAAAASAEDCTGPQCCACEPSEAVEPAPLPRLYLPSVQRTPPMSSEFTPVHPAPTVTPEVSGDVAR